MGPVVYVCAYNGTHVITGNLAGSPFDFLCQIGVFTSEKIMYLSSRILTA